MMSSVYFVAPQGHSEYVDHDSNVETWFNLCVSANTYTHACVYKTKKLNESSFPKINKYYFNYRAGTQDYDCLQCKHLVTIFGDCVTKPNN